MVSGKGYISCIEDVKYTSKNGNEVEGFLCHCILPEFGDDGKILYQRVARCWVKKDSKLKIRLDANVQIRYGKFGEYIESFLD